MLFFHEKARVAQEKGALAVLVANQPNDILLSPDSTEPGDAGVTIPVVVISNAAGVAVKAGLTANPALTGTLHRGDMGGASHPRPLGGKPRPDSHLQRSPHQHADPGQRSLPRR